MSHEQTMQSLDHANEIRCARARLKERIAAGKVSPLEVLEEPPEYAEGMRVRDVLMAVKYLGPNKVDGVLARSMVPFDKKVSKLTAAQRVRLDERLSSQNAWLQAISH